MSEKNYIDRSQITSPGKILAEKYKIIEVIGQGGTGKVFKAIDIKKNKKLVAIKEIDYTLVPDPIQQEHLKEITAREIEMLTRLNHPILPGFLDSFEESPRQYVVMEFIEGATLDIIIKKSDDFLNEELVKHWAMQICEILEYLHNQDPPVIYRDLKPSNIMLEKSGYIKLIDFGIARTYKTGKKSDTIPFFTKGYAPPEQYCQQTDTRSDVYALGATLHTLLTKHNPGKNPFYLPKIRSINKTVSEEVETIIMKALELKAEKRWQKIEDIRKALVKTQKTTYEVITKISAIEKLFFTDSPLSEKSTSSLLTVSNTEDGQFQSIKNAIDLAKPGDTILILPGLYQERIRITKDISIAGNGNISDIIIETYDEDCISMRTNRASVKNLTLRSNSGPLHRECYGVYIPDGHLTLENCDISSKSLACIAIHGAVARITADKCKIHDGKDGGVIFYERSEGTLTDCDIFNNSPAGIMISEHSNPVIKNCTIRDGPEYGIYIYDNGYGTIENCKINNNKAAGIRIKEKSNPNILNCDVKNSKKYGIQIVQKSGSYIENCTILSSGVTGIEIMENSNPVIKNCKIKKNKISGINIRKNGRGIIENCEIMENGKSDLNIEKNSKPEINNCKTSKKCFITTAACQSLSKSEDCYELNRFREFRDRWLINEKDGENLIKEYYSIAPEIIKNIDKLSYNDKIYKNIWNDFLVKCLYLIETENFKEAKKCYIQLLEKLKISFLN